MAGFASQPCYSIFRSELHGDGVKSISSIVKGSTIFKEKPMFCLQSVDNRTDVLSCSYCFRFIGTEELQLRYLERRIARPYLNSLFSSHDVSLKEDPTFQDCHSCDHFCGLLYCSELCRDAHWQQSHQLLCTGTISEEDASSSPLLQFKTHSMATNEIFLMVADIFATVCKKVDSGVSVQDAIAPMEGYVRNLWWEAAISPADSDPIEFEATLKALVEDSWELLSKTLSLNTRGLEEVLSKEYFSRTVGMFEQNNVGVRLESPCALRVKLLGPGSQDEDNVIRYLRAAETIVEGLQEWSDAEEEDGVEEQACSSECSSSAENRDSCGSQDVKCSGEAEHHHDDHNDGEGDDGEEEGGLLELTGDTIVDKLRTLVNDEGMENIFPPLDGTAFYATICKINHSCVPNVRVKYASDAQLGLHAALVALSNIEPNTELVQSYIDHHLDYPKRKKALAEYGIECTCQKCIDDRNKL